MIPSVQFTGFKELDEFLKKLPQECAKQLQAVVVKNHLDHRKEIMRSSTFSPEGTRNLRFAIQVWPRSRKEPKRLQDVQGGTSSFWRGADIEDPGEGVAARVEKRVGVSVTAPLRKRFLLIPWGDFTTPSGRPRRERRSIHGHSVMAPVLLRYLRGTRWVRGQNGQLRLIQRLEPGERGKFEAGAAKGIHKKRLGERERVVGLAVRQAKVVQGLDFFGSWERLEKARDDRYDRFLLSVLT